MGVSPAILCLTINAHVNVHITPAVDQITKRRTLSTNCRPVGTLNVFPTESGKSRDRPTSASKLRPKRTSIKDNSIEILPDIVKKATTVP